MEAFGRFLDILDELRVKCPWDSKQTNESLRPNTIEAVSYTHLDVYKRQVLSGTVCLWSSFCRSGRCGRNCAGLSFMDLGKQIKSDYRNFT